LTAYAKSGAQARNDDVGIKSGSFGHATVVFPAAGQAFWCAVEREPIEMILQMQMFLVINVFQ
jgi:hypothetical protein